MWALPRFLILIAAATPACAGSFSFGVRGGVPLAGFFENVKLTPVSYFNSNTRPYLIGATGEVRLPAGFAAEVDALYRHFSYDLYTPYYVTNFHTFGSSWEFPLLLKARFGVRSVKPYVDGGISLDTLNGLRQTITTVNGSTQQVFSTTPTGNPNELKSTTILGFVIGAGVDIHAVAHLMPEIRYTRWNSAHFAILNGRPLSNQNQLELLVGITF
jgi:opacity protein-like surface antigen